MALEPQRESLAKTSIKQKKIRIEPRLAFINGVLLANRVLIFSFQLLAACMSRVAYVAISSVE
jgi:hypothetical protein